MQSSILGTIVFRIFIFLLGVIMVLPALNMLYTYCNYRYLGSIAYGTIDHPSSGRDLGGRPLIKYLDKVGNVHEFKSKAKTHWFASPERGEKIKVFIHGSDMQKAIVDSLFHYVLLPLVFLAAGLYICLYAIFNRKGLSMEEKVVSVQ